MPRRRTPVVVALVLVSVLVFVLGFSLAKRLGRVAPEAARAAHPARTFEIPSPGIAGDGIGSAISPDGKHVAYVGEGRIRVHSLELVETRDLEGTEGAGLLCWSPGSDEIAYRSRESLWRVLREGGAPRRICVLHSGWSVGAGLAWGAGDRIVFSSGYQGLYEVSAGGGEVRSLIGSADGLPEHFHVPSFLPDGKSLLYARHGPQGVDSLEVLVGGARKTILHQPGARLDEPCWSPTGHVLFQRHSESIGVWALPFSLELLEATGEPFLVASSSARPTVSKEGALLHFVTGAGPRHTLGWVDEEGAVDTFGEAWTSIEDPALSPDGKHVVAAATERNSTEIYVYDLKRGAWNRLTHDGLLKERPRWAPRGEVVYGVLSSGARRDVFRVSTNGTAKPVMVVEDASVPDVSRDGRWLVFHRDGALLALDLEQGGEPFRVMEDAGWWPALSPDGRWIAYQSDSSGRVEVYLRLFPSGSDRWLVSNAGGRLPHWSPSGDRLDYLEGEGPRGPSPTSLVRWLSVSFQPGPEPALGVPEPLHELRDFYPTDFDPATRRYLAVVHARDPSQVAFPLRVTLDWLPEGQGR